MPPRKEAQGLGLRLNMPHAPSSWHHMPDLGLWVHPIHATPCGGPAEPTVAQARAWAADPLLQVTVTDIHDIDAARETYDAFQRELRGIAPRIIRAAEGDETLIAAAQANPDRKDEAA